MAKRAGPIRLVESRHDLAHGGDGIASHEEEYGMTHHREENGMTSAWRESASPPAGRESA